MKKIILELAVPLSIILFAVVLRFIPHPPNFAPVTALALFGGLYLNKHYALAVPFVVLLISDYFIGFHETMFFTYGSFALIGLIGLFMRKYKSALTIFGASVFSSLLFYLITNFGVWFMYDMYPHDISGLLDSYVMGIPFFRNTFIGDIVYTTLFCGSYELLARVVGVQKKAL